MPRPPDPADRVLMAYSPTVRAGQIIFDCEVAITAIGIPPIMSSSTRIMV